MFQNSSEIKTILETQYKLFIRSSDASGYTNFFSNAQALSERPSASTAILV